jgi:hypothetical protein
MTGPPGRMVEAAPPDKRAKPNGIPVRLYDGTLVAHANRELEDRLLTAGVAESFRRGPRRYLRLRQGITQAAGIDGGDGPVSDRPCAQACRTTCKSWPRSR